MASAPRPNPLAERPSAAKPYGQKGSFTISQQNALDWEAYSVMPDIRKDSYLHAPGPESGLGARAEESMARPNGHQVSVAAAQQVLEEKFALLNSSLIATRDYAMATLRHIHTDAAGSSRVFASASEHTVRSRAPSVVDIPHVTSSAVVPIPPNGSAPSISELAEDAHEAPSSKTAVDTPKISERKPMEHWASIRSAWKVKATRINKGSTFSIFRAPTLKEEGQTRQTRGTLQSNATAGNKASADVEPTRQKRMTEAPRRGVFGDVESLKDKVLAATRQEEYNVFNMYKTEGISQRIARSSLFDNVTLVVIFFHALWIGIDCQLNSESVITKSPIGFQLIEHFFCLYFFFEWLVRFCAFKTTQDAFRDKWFAFDTALVVPMLLDTWLLTIVFLIRSGNSEDGLYGDSTILRLIRMIRLSRVCRVARLLNAMPEVMILIKGATVAARSVILTLGLLGVIIYVFAIAFVQLTRGVTVGDAYFASIVEAMKTLLLNATFLEDIPDVYKAVAQENELLGILLLIYIFLASLTVMNMLIGVLVEVVSVVAAVEKESLVVNYVKQYLETIWVECGMDNRQSQEEAERRSRGVISQDEFEQFLQHPDTLQCLSNVGVDVVGLVDLGGFLFRDGHLSFGTFMEAVLTLRGSQTSKVRDIVDLRKFMILEMEDLEYKANLRNHAMLDHVMRTEALVERVVTEVQKTSPSPEETTVEAIDVHEAWGQ